MNWKHIGLLTAGHFITDINQGALPAILPFLIAEHHLSYQGAAGLVFALNMSSSVAQPLFGLYSDRMSKPWLIPIGVFLAGVGLAALGLASRYGAWFTVAAISGLGIAAFHPEGARFTNFAAGEKRATAISVFGIGGTLGIALGPIFVTSFLVHFGLRGTLVLAFPATLMALLLFQKFSTFSSPSVPSGHKPSQHLTERDEWPPFLRLTGTVICRSVIFFGLNTFIPLYWIDVLKQSRTAGGTALTILLSAGVVGQILGGRLADQYGHRAVIKASFAFLILALLLFATGPDVTLSTMLLIPIGMAMSSSYSPMVVMGQRYLPGRVAFSSGITLGMTVSAGGMVVPLLGWLADRYGLGFIFWVLAGVPVLGTLITFYLPLPQIDRKSSPLSAP